MLRNLIFVIITVFVVIVSPFFTLDRRTEFIIKLQINLIVEKIDIKAVNGRFLTVFHNELVADCVCADSRSELAYVCIGKLLSRNDVAHTVVVIIPAEIVGNVNLRFGVRSSAHRIFKRSIITRLSLVPVADTLYLSELFAEHVYCVILCNNIRAC